MLIIRRSFAWKTRRWSWPRENGSWRNSLKKTGGKLSLLSLSLILSFIVIHLTNTIGIANIISVILSWSSSYSSFSCKKSSLHGKLSYWILPGSNTWLWSRPRGRRYRIKNNRINVAIEFFLLSFVKLCSIFFSRSPSSSPSMRASQSRSPVSRDRG